MPYTTHQKGTKQITEARPQLRRVTCPWHGMIRPPYLLFDGDEVFLGVDASLGAELSEVRLGLGGQLITTDRGDVRRHEKTCGDMRREKKENKLNFSTRTKLVPPRCVTSRRGRGKGRRRGEDT